METCEKTMLFEAHRCICDMANSELSRHQTHYLVCGKRKAGRPKKGLPAM